MRSKPAITEARGASESNAAGLGQSLQGSPIQAGYVDTAAEIADGSKRPLGGALADDGRYRGLANRFDGCQTDAEFRVLL